MIRTRFGTPRHCNTLLQMPVEVALRNALVEIERLPASTEATRATQKIVEAQELVADILDDILKGDGWPNAQRR